MLDVTTTIDRPVDEVAAWARDPSHGSQWCASTTSVEGETPPPLALGSRVRFVAGFLGRTLRCAYEVTGLGPGRRLVVRTARGPFPRETTCSWQPAEGGGTAVVLRDRGEPTGSSRAVAPVTASAVRRANGQDPARLKALLEQGAR